MKRFLPYILIITILVQLFAPFGVGLSEKNNVEVQSNNAEAEEAITVTTTAAASSKTITATATVRWGVNDWKTTEDHVIITLVDSSGKVISGDVIKVEQSGKDPKTGEYFQTGYVKFSNLTPDTPYGIKTSAMQFVTTWLQNIVSWIPTVGVAFPPNPSPNTTTMSDPDPFPVRTLATGDQEVAVAGEQTSINDTSILPVCSISSWSVGSCVGVFIYRAIFQPSAYLFAITGKLVDYTFFYTIQDTSYRSQFVVEGWKTVRDFCNMFFIFILLYVAIGTVLSLNGVKTKEMIINIVIIGLLINFSLFATQVVIDASNILARVFYNQILVGTKDKNDNIIKEELGFGGSKQLTVALVNKINPQKLIINAKKASNIQIKGNINTNSDVRIGQVDSGTFIMIAIMASIMNIVGLYVFFMVSVVFIARVIGLWLAMVLVPIAFFSYTVPQMQDMEMVGWKKWWPETLKLAFLAPVFIMFLYLIIKFLDTGLGVLNADGKEGLDFFISIIVPFAFLMVLLLKAKDITTKMSGKIGETFTGIAKTVGGFAVGAGLGLATGGAAMAMRGTVGKLGSKIGESEWAKKNRFTRTIGDAGKWTASKSFDVRATKLGAAAGKEMGVDMGKAKEGGYTKYKAETKEKREKRAKSLEVGENAQEMQDLHQKEEALKELENKYSAELEALKGKIASGQTDSADKSRRASDLEAVANKDGATDADKTAAIDARADAKKASEELQQNKDKKKAITDDVSKGAFVNVSAGSVKKADDDATAAENNARAASEGVPEITTRATEKADRAIAQANTDAQTAITTANADAQASIARANADAQASIAQANANAQAATQAKTAAFNKSMMNPSQESAAAYQQTIVNETNAKANLATVTIKTNADIAKSNADAQDSITKANADAQTKLTETTNKANATKQQTITDATDNVAKKQTDATNKRRDATTLRNHNVNGTKMQRSMKELEFDDIPTAKHTISTINSGRKTKYANEIENRIFNKEINKSASHNIRMNAEIKSEVKSH